METFQAKIVNRTATVQPAAVPTKTVQNRAAAVRSPAPIQMATKVSSPHDPAEKEAEVTARKIMRMTISEGSAAYKSGSGGILFRQIKNQNLPFSITRFSSVTHILAKQKEEILQRKADTQPLVTPKATADIQNSMAGGSPLPPSVRRFMEPRFRADFSQVKVHTSDKAAKLNRQLNARAFTMGNHLFFGKEQFKPESSEGKELIAHELTHTIQQGGVIQRSEEVNVTQQAPVQIQRLGLSDALGYFADKANFIPGFRMLTIILGVNPINMSRVERSAANILRAIVEFIPGGALITQALDNHGIVNKVGQWIEQQIQSLGMTAGVIKQAISKFLDSLSWSDIFNLGNVWELAKRILTEPIDRLINFAKGLITGILQFIKEAILRPLAKLAEGTRGYDLLKAVLGEDPVTGESVPRTADTLIGGFMKLIGQEEVWTNLKQANAVARAWAWFQGALSSLVGLVRQIPSMFIQTVKSLELADVVLIPRAFAKVVGVFGNFIGSFLKWAGDAVWTLLEIIFAVVAPGAIPYLKKAAGAFRSILKNPISFVGNLIQAGKRGFLQFADNIGKYLKTSLIQWLTGTLVGVYLPQSFEIREIIKFVLSVLNLTWQTIRQKLVRVVGERVVTAMETGLDIVVTLVREGPAAVWEKIKEQVTNLKETVIEGITSFVTSKIVQSAVIKIVSMLNPVGAVIQAILTIYDTIMFFIERLKQIAQVTMAFLDSISAIAAGVIAAAANRVEQTLAGLLTLAISFLARFAGLGKVSDAVMNIIKKLQVPVEKALDAVVGWVVVQARRLGRFVAQAGVPQDPNERLRLGMQAAASAVRHLPGNRIGREIIIPALGAVKLRYGFQTLEPFTQNRRWWLRGKINPNGITDTGIANTGEKEATAQGCDTVQIGTLVVYHLPGEPIGTRITDINVQMQVGGQTFYGVKLEYKNIWVPCNKFGKVWSIPSKPPFVPFQDNPPRIVIDKEHLNSGSRASYDPPFLREFPCKTGKVVVAIRGHLVAKVLGGPGGRNNIVALTIEANEQMRSSIEVPLKKDIDENRSVYFYTARPVYPGGDTKQPVESVEIEVIPIYPPNKQQIVDKHKIIKNQC